MLKYRNQKKPTAPVRVATDTVIRLGREDDRAILRGMSTNYMMRFDDVLDPQKLRLSLERLLNRHDWRKLGARLRLNDDDKLEYHIPAEFTEKRPAIAYSHVKHNMTISEHPLASKLPKATSKPAIVGDPSEFRSLSSRPGGPTKLADYIYTDEPQISLHVVSFSDATLVSLSWLHTLTDVMGRKELLDAWSLVLDGRDNEVRSLHGFDFDPLEQLHEDAMEVYKLADKTLSRFQLIYFGLRYALESIRFKDEQRIVCIPGAYVNDIRQKALQKLNAKTVDVDRGDEKQAVNFVSEGDVLSAWWLRHAIAHIRRGSNQTVAVFNPFGLRILFANDLLPRTKAYVGNAVMGAVTYLSAKDIQTKPIWDIASALRQSLVEQTTREQIKGQAKIIRETYARTGYEPLFGDGGMHFVRYTNWTKAKLFDTDFSAAIVRQGVHDAQRCTKSGRPSYIQYDVRMSRYSPRGSFPIYGKDAAGNYWLGGWVRKGLWDVISKNLKRGFH
ncbi:uncharacterized protein LY79DRAFT_677214 [Colletotrichum navitas]|uniref:LysR family regulatory protein n=1 Tax=Colletotrichum navitas TaxID=681940 RepID=A0AAD8PMR4_9PEZI|nr:uncharacterized protein LY79DRAFT_677214 [Colletotrichum navitas]KAK1573001.1 hypothetical protein LY79DRAFT_677214 [Colletotrichum navitas]